MPTKYAARFLRLAFLIWIMWPALASAIEAHEDELPILPNEADYEAQDRGQDCSVLRAVLRHAESEIIDVAAQRQSYKSVVLQKQQEVVACADRERLPMSREPRELALIAEACPREYDAWVFAGTHYRLVRDDHQQQLQSLRLLVGHASRRCLPLPEAPNLLMPADGGGEIPPPPVL